MNSQGAGWFQALVVMNDLQRMRYAILIVTYCHGAGWFQIMRGRVGHFWFTPWILSISNSQVWGLVPSFESQLQLFQFTTSGYQLSRYFGVRAGSKSRRIWSTDAIPTLTFLLLIFWETMADGHFNQSGWGRSPNKVKEGWPLFWRLLFALYLYKY